MILLLFVNTAMAEFQQVKIGEISKKYKSSLSQQQLYNLIQEIKAQFEAQLGFSVFEYTENGHPIDILHVSESQKKKRLNRYLDELNFIKNKIEQLEEKILDEKNFIKKFQQDIKEEAEALNQTIKNLNNSVKNINQRVSSLSKEKHYVIKQNIENEREKIEHSQQALKKGQRELKSDIRSFNRMTHRYNYLINKYNSYVIRIETLSKSIVEVKGKAIGKSISEIKTYYADGKQVTEKKNYSEMEKIEIYGFDGDINQLKAVLAHELGHLVGIGHIDKKRALMNPFLQSNQIDNLELTKDDMKAFKKAFK